MPPSNPGAAANLVEGVSENLSASALRWWAGGFCVFLGALAVVVPGQFTAYAYSSISSRMALWGLAFTAAGWALLAAASLRLRPSVHIAAHVLVAAVFALLAGGVAVRAAWSGTIVYSLVSLTLLASASLPVREVGRRRIGGDVLALAMGTVGVAVGAWLMLFAGRADPRIYLATPSQLRWVGLGLLVTGVPLFAVQLRPAPRWLRNLVHLAAGAALVVVAVTFWPARSWTGVLFYGSSGLLVASLPFLRRRLRNFDPGSLSARLAVLLAAATSLPVVTTLGILELGKQPILENDQRVPAFCFLIFVVGMALVLGIWGARGLVLPLRRLAEGADQMAADEPLRNLPMTGITEMDRLSSAFSHMRGRLATRAREAEDLTQELRRRAEALAEADRRKDEFLAMLAHELRNPLGAIASASHLLNESEAADPRVERAIPVIQRQMQHLTRMVDDLLDVSRITRGKVDLRRQRLNLAETVAHTVQSMEDRALDAELELVTDLPAEPVWVEADGTRLEQVLGNLLTNAIRYTEEGGRVTVCLEALDEERQACLRVRDTGIGMSEELLSRVFDLFSQGERSLERHGGGLGIGLTLVRQLVEMHDGTVEARSAGSHQGSEFEVRLDLVD